MSPYYQHLRQSAGDALLLIPSVAAIVHNEEGSLLLIEKHDGSWSLPAGAIEPGESPEESVVRELLEETGLTCDQASLLACVGGSRFRHPYPNGDRAEYTVAIYHCLTSGALSPTDLQEVRSLQFFAREDLPDLALPYCLSTLYLEDSG